MKVFRMDEMQWIAAESEEEAIEFFMGEYADCEQEELDIIEMDLDKEGMWWCADNKIETLSKKVEKYNYDGYEHFGGIDEWEGEPAVFIPYREALKLNKETTPCIIAVCYC